MGNIIVTVQTKLLKNICLFSGQNTQYITRAIRVTWHWGHQALSLGFVRGRKSVVQLLLTINCALKFYSLFMMCNVIWFMWTQWVTGSNCGCFRGLCPHDDLQKLQLPERFQRLGPPAVRTLLLDTSKPEGKSVPALVPLDQWGEIQTILKCFLTHGGDSVLVIMGFLNRKYWDGKGDSSGSQKKSASDYTARDIL